MRIGFIGVGNMGGPMCRNIIKGGHDVRVFDRADDAVAKCVDVGGTAAPSIEAAIADAEIVMTSLPMPTDVETVALGPGGICEHAKPGTIYADLSTNSPTVIRRVAAELEQHGITMIDSPVSGGVVGAERASIAIMVGGDRSAFDTCLPVFESFGENITHLGPLGCGAIAKIVNNMIAFSTMAAGAEGLMLGAAAGIDPTALTNVVRASSGDSGAFRGVAHKTLRGDWSASFALDLAYKDLHLALELADELGVPLMLGPQTHNLMRLARGLGFGADDTTAIMRVYEETLGRTVRADD